MNFVSFWRNCERMGFVSSVFGVPVNVWNVSGVVNVSQFLACDVWISQFWATCVWVSSVFGVPVNVWISSVLGVPVKVWVSSVFGVTVNVWVSSRQFLAYL